MQCLRKRLYGLILVSLFFSACSEEEVQRIEIPEELIGQWLQVGEVSANCPDASDNSSIEKDCTNDYCLEYIFEASGSLIRRSIENGNRIVEINEFELYTDEIFIKNGLVYNVLNYSISSSI